MTESPSLLFLFKDFFDNKLAESAFFFPDSRIHFMQPLFQNGFLFKVDYPFFFCLQELVSLFL